ncbi:MAG: protein-L-isoaspartate(D-aspartate) O-methyltransferase [Methylomonas sp.]|nr:protein-L-isoaspartate(D-aspartate) O-methyltransferase [Methylomonas sp.]
MKKTLHLIFWLIVIGIVLLLFSGLAVGEKDWQRQREDLVGEVEAMVASTRDYLQQEALDKRVLDALRKVPRHEFVPANRRAYAYSNQPVTIGYGQTISQPYIVAIMTEMIKPEPGHKVLEVGTGSGYQAAILAELGVDMYSIEIIEPLAEQAANNLKQTGYTAVHTRSGDGYYGWESEAPFDAIIVTAVASHIPPPLIKQLKPGGRMIIPVGSAFMNQYLILVIKGADGKVTTRQILPVSFVPLTGTH